MKLNSFIPSLAIAAVAAIANGCTSISTSAGAERQELPESTSPGYQALYKHENKRVQGTGNVNVLFGIFAWGANGFADNSDLSSYSFLPSPANYARSAAVYDACQSSGADTLLGTRYTVKTTDYFVFKQVECTVVGYPATIIGVEEKFPFILGKDERLIYLGKSAIEDLK